MATRASIQKLTKTQIGTIRHGIAREAGKVAARLKAHALGQTPMSNSEIKAASIVLGHVLPAQASTQWEDVTEPARSKDAVEAEYMEALGQLAGSDLRLALQQIPKDERQALIDSLGETSQ